MNVADILANAYVELGRYFNAATSGNPTRAQGALERLRKNLATIPLETLRPAARQEISTFIEIIAELDSPDSAYNHNQKSLLGFLAPFALHRRLLTQ